MRWRGLIISWEMMNMNNNTRTKQKAVKMTQPNSQKSSSKKRRERRNRAKGNINVASGPAVSSYPLPTYSNTGMRALSKIPRRRLTSQGEAFLKCAFAPPDFAASSPTGVPDDYRGPSLLKKHRLVGQLNCNVANTDYYLLLAPAVGGVSYYSTTVAAGTPILNTTVFKPVYYSDQTSLFPSDAQMADIVTKYRFVSNHIELIPTMNQMSWSGSIQAWKFPLSMSIRTGSAAVGNLYTVTGLQSCNATNSNQYTGPTNLGLYSAAYSAGSEFEFQPVIEGLVACPAVILSSDFGQLTNSFGGVDEQFESVVIKISGMGANISNSFVIKTWACVEYMANPGTSIYEYQTLSPCDAYALELYKSIILQLPVGVSFLENEGFWKRVLNIIRNVSGALSILPGEYGAISSGVNLVASGIESLTL